MTEKKTDEILSFRPLYMQVRDRLVARLADGTWPPGTSLPNEFQIADEIGVSQGTVRKALDSMAAANLIVRRQGSGTLVPLPEENRILFQFFKLTAKDGVKHFPASKVLSVRKGTASRYEALRLQIAPKAPVWRIQRVREIAGRPALNETIVLSCTTFAQLPAIPDVPNNIYQLYSAGFGKTIARASEKLSAEPATAQDAKRLGCKEGAPMLIVDRLALGLNDEPIELRISRCLTEHVEYVSDLF